MILSENCTEYEAMEVELSYFREGYEENVGAAKGHRESVGQALNKPLWLQNSRQLS